MHACRRREFGGYKVSGAQIEGANGNYSGVGIEYVHETHRRWMLTIQGTEDSGSLNCTYVPYTFASLFLMRDVVHASMHACMHLCVPLN